MFDSNSTLSSCTDHTTLYKSCVKTIRARSKASGAALPPSRVFPNSTNKYEDAKSLKNDSEVKKKKSSVSTSQFFLRARDIQKNVIRHKQLLNDHRRKYIGQINDPSSMSQEECIYMDKVIGNNLKSIEQQLVELEGKVSASLLQKIKRTNHNNRSARPGDPFIEAIKSVTTGVQGVAVKTSAREPDVECCMAVTAVILRTSLTDLATTFADMKQAKCRKQTVKAKLMRLQRPAGVEKQSTELMRRQQKLGNAAASGDSEPITTDRRKKVQLEDWRDDDERISGKSSSHPINKSTNSSKSTASVNNKSSAYETRNSLEEHHENKRKFGDSALSSRKHLTAGDGASESRRNDGSEAATEKQSTSDKFSGVRRSGNYGPGAAEFGGDAVSEDERQMLEQENMQLYNELQSEQEEVRQITRAVVELGRLQDVILENVEEQAKMADSTEHQVMSATGNVQQGNEQIREAMRKDASFRVWIMFFLIVMSFTILFLDWYND